MNIINKTILITGGGSGIGLEIAKLLSADNKVIIVGRDLQKLKTATNFLPNIIAIQADVTKEDDIHRLVDEIRTKYQDLSILINNAGHAYAYKLSESSNTYEKALSEFSTNYLAPIRLTEKLLPILKQQPEAAIINVSSIVAFTPGISIPTYSDSKAALHSYTQSLRHILSKETSIKVFELMPPLVNTDFSVEIGGKEHGMPASEVAESLIDALKNNIYEIHVGQTAHFYKGFFNTSQNAFYAMNP